MLFIEYSLRSISYVNQSANLCKEDVCMRVCVGLKSSFHISHMQYNEPYLTGSSFAVNIFTPSSSRISRMRPLFITHLCDVLKFIQANTPKIGKWPRIKVTKTYEKNRFWQNAFCQIDRVYRELSFVWNVILSKPRGGV